jgi:hypothetical protein
MVSVAVACLPAAVSLLSLAALFMQISGVSLTLTWPCRLCLFRVLLCASLCYKLSPFQALGKVTLHHFSGLRVCLQLTWEVDLPLSPVEFCSLHHSHKLSRFWLLGARPRSHRSLSSPPVLFTVPGRIPSPQSSALSAPHPLSRVSLLFLLLIAQFLFFPRVGVGLSRGLCCSGPGLSVGVPRYH